VTAAAKLPTPIGLAELLTHEGDATKHLGDRPFAWHVDPRAERPDVLAFDLAAEGGWFYLGAVRREAGIIDAANARIDGPWSRRVQSVVERGRLLADMSERKLLVIAEDTHLGSAQRTPYAFAAVTRYGAGVAFACAQAGLTMIRVPAQTWQSRILGKIRRDQGKVMSMKVAQSNFGGSITSDHIADASLLALWVRGRGR
jgi:hypothetical protein